MLLPLLLLACGTAPVPDAARIPYEGGSVAGTLDKLVAAEERRARLEEQAKEGVSAERVAALEERVAALELAYAQLETTGVLPAETIGYDPRTTTLSARDVQAAVTELHERIKALEVGRDPPMGEPGPGLWTRVEPASNQQGMGPPGGPGGPPQGPPPGGEPGGQR